MPDASAGPVNYVFPFPPGARLIELGGGANPRVRPNVDARPGPSVDLVADFNKPLPIKSGEWDGVLSIYNIEHLSWRRVRGFISEVHRILIPGGLFVVITANLKAQCAMLAAMDRWEDKDIGTIFGDQDYQGQDWVANAHHAGFSPEFADRLFREQGFYDIITMPLPGCATDLIIEARKSQVEILTAL